MVLEASSDYRDVHVKYDNDNNTTMQPLAAKTSRNDQGQSCNPALRQVMGQQNQHKYKGTTMLWFRTKRMKRQTIVWSLKMKSNCSDFESNWSDVE